MKDIGDWGHEYIRLLEAELVESVYLEKYTQKMKQLTKDIVNFNCTHHAEIQACDLLMELDEMDCISQYINSTIYQRICMYILSCAKFVEDPEARKLKKIVAYQYMKFDEAAKALVIAIHIFDTELMNEIFSKCKNM